MPDAVTGEVIYGMIPSNSSWDSADYRLFNYSSSFYRDMNSSRIAGGTFNSGTIYEIEVGNNYVKNVGSSSNIISGSTVSGYTGATTIKLNYDEYDNKIQKVTWHYVKIYEGDTLVRDFIPCLRISDSVPGMWDKVNEVFYTSKSGTEYIAVLKNSGGGTSYSGGDEK